MIKYNTEELSEVILQTANALTKLADGVDKSHEVIYELAQAMNHMNDMIFNLTKEIKVCHK